MNPHGTRGLRELGGQRGFWEEGAFVQNCACDDGGLHMAQTQGAFRLPPPRPGRQGSPLLSSTDEETGDQGSTLLQCPDLPETVLKFPHPRGPPQSWHTRMAGRPLSVTGRGLNPRLTDPTHLSPPRISLFPASPAFSLLLRLPLLNSSAESPWSPEEWPGPRLPWIPRAPGCAGPPSGSLSPLVFLRRKR